MNSSKKKLTQKLNSFISILFNYCCSKLRRKKIKNNLNGSSEWQTNLDKRLVYSLSKSRIPNLRQIKYIKKFLSQREVWAIRFSFLVILVCLFFLGTRYYIAHLQVVPAQGGEYTEGLIGAPKYINPIYSSASDVDSDISQLVFSSLFKRGEQGELINDLVESYEVSQDNKIYTFKIKENVLWHSGELLTADDIVFTFNIIKNSQYKSPLYSSFKGVEIEKEDNRTVRFILDEPYAAFLELLTLGILPQNLWLQIPFQTASLAELNLKPVGSGPYKFKSLAKDKNGNIKIYNLESNNDYYGHKAYIKSLTFKFFINFDEAITALNENLIDGISYLPKQYSNNIVAKNSFNLYKLNIPQLTAIFLNTKTNSALADKLVRQALALAINKNEIVSTTLEQDVRLVDGPILPDSFAYYKDLKKYKYNIEEAMELLDKAGWQLVEITEEDIAKAEEGKDSEANGEKGKAQAILNLGLGQWRQKDNNYLIIRFSTVDRDENKQIAEAIKKFWEEVSIKVITEFVTVNQVQPDIIKPRNFEALFYGQVIGSDPDPYAFWHSSQIGETGFNITNFVNKEVDQLLEDARLIFDKTERQEKYKRFQEIVAEEIPAIFMYSPLYTYIQSKNIKGFSSKNIFIPSDRFGNITDWYIKTKKKLVW